MPWLQCDCESGIDTVTARTFGSRVPEEQGGTAGVETLSAADDPRDLRHIPCASVRWRIRNEHRLRSMLPLRQQLKRGSPPIEASIRRVIITLPDCRILF